MFSEDLNCSWCYYCCFNPWKINMASYPAIFRYGFDFLTSTWEAYLSNGSTSTPMHCYKIPVSIFHLSNIHRIQLFTYFTAKYSTGVLNLDIFFPAGSDKCTLTFIWAIQRAIPWAFIWTVHCPFNHLTSQPAWWSHPDSHPNHSNHPFLHPPLSNNPANHPKPHWFI